MRTVFRFQSDILRDFVPINRNVYTCNMDNSNAAYTSQIGYMFSYYIISQFFFIEFQ